MARVPGSGASWCGNRAAAAPAAAGGRGQLLGVCIHIQTRPGGASSAGLASCASCCLVATRPARITAPGRNNCSSNNCTRPNNCSCSYSRPGAINTPRPGAEIPHDQAPGAAIPRAGYRAAPAAARGQDRPGGPALGVSARRDQAGASAVAPRENPRPGGPWCDTWT